MPRKKTYTQGQPLRVQDHARSRYSRQAAAQVLLQHGKPCRCEKESRGISRSLRGVGAHRRSIRPEKLQLLPVGAQVAHDLQAAVCQPQHAPDL